MEIPSRLLFNAGLLLLVCAPNSFAGAAIVRPIPPVAATVTGLAGAAVLQTLPAAFTITPSMRGPTPLAAGQKPQAAGQDDPIARAVQEGVDRAFAPAIESMRKTIESRRKLIEDLKTFIEHAERVERRGIFGWF